MIGAEVGEADGEIIAVDPSGCRFDSVRDGRSVQRLESPQVPAVGAMAGSGALGREDSVDEPEQDDDRAAS